MVKSVCNLNIPICIVRVYKMVFVYKKEHMNTNIAANDITGRYTLASISSRYGFGEKDLLTERELSN